MRRVYLLLLFWGMAMAAGFKIYSPAFDFGAPIPSRYTCDGADVSPPLVFEHVPANAASLVLAVLDPDAPGGTFVHWVAYDLPPGLKGLPEGVPKGPLVDGFKQALNDFGFAGYGGPCPPPGHGPHRYFFTLFALDAPGLELGPGASAREVLAAIKGHVLAEAEWMGVYQR